MTLAKTSEANSHVQRQIDAGNDWYTSSQFEWARQPHIWRIYRAREKFIVACVQRLQKSHIGPVRVLDAGCGDGYWLYRLSRLSGLELVGMDYNPLRLARATCAAPGARLVKGDLTSLGEGEIFDVILFSQVLEHIPDDMAALAQLSKRLAPGGTLILGVPNEGSRLHQRRIKMLGSAFKTDHIHFYTESMMRATLHAAGLSIGAIHREVFYVGIEEVYYRLTRSGVGYRLLALLSWLCPAECSGFYFECKVGQS